MYHLGTKIAILGTNTYIKVLLCTLYGYIMYKGYLFKSNAAVTAVFF